MNLFRRFFLLLPTLLLSFVLAVAVWISAVTSTDPIQERDYTRQVSIEIIGQDPASILTSQNPGQVTLRLSAPASVWERLNNERNPIRAVTDLSGLGQGTFSVPVQLQVLVEPVRVVSYSPRDLVITLEKLTGARHSINLIRRGDLAIGYEAGIPVLDSKEATVSGPESLVNRVKTLQVILNLDKADQDLTRSLEVQALDENQIPVSGITISPAQVTVTQPVSQRGGYRNVVVKVVTTGQVANGYRLTTISVFPPAVTVFASDPTLVDTLPGYVETTPIDLTNAKDDVDVRVALNLPTGVSVVGDQTVNVVVGVAAIEGSLTLKDMRVEVINLGPRLAARLSPNLVNIILSGPLPLLDKIQSGDVRIIIDLAGVTSGTYQLAPRVELAIAELRVESILPGSIEVVVGPAGPATPTPRPTPQPTPTPKP